ncbi:hypothetical protein FBFR_16140 [Flavobacterium fryxellicola]|uniref:Uncharacterized protein n=2 Tax=Flavobacterium fryxellicola TaxID=249352 RepID=A0A167U2Z1_9FLAO|nr:hypothetical protein FBFR_16140 [Flavobacterium fryxellicola]
MLAEISKKNRMDKKFIYLNTTIIVLIILVFIFGDYFSPIEMKFQYWWNTKNFEWEILVMIFIVSPILSAVISLKKIKHLNYKIKISRVLFFINSLIVLFLVFQFTKFYLNTKTELTKRENELIEIAKKDIKEDNVTYKFAGGLKLPLFTKENENKIDSIQKKYGVKYVNTGCVVDLTEIQAQEKYKETVKPYLDKRNGKNWENIMETEIETLK